MEILRTETSPEKLEVDAVVVGVYDEGPLVGPAETIDRAAGGLLATLLERREIGRGEGQTTLLLAPPGVAAQQVLVVGLGPRGKLSSGVAYRAAAAAARALSTKPRAEVAFFLGHEWNATLQENMVAGAMVGCHGQDLYRAEKERHPFGKLRFGDVKTLSLQAGMHLGNGVNLTRRLVNEPPQAIYPESFAQQAEIIANECGLQIEIWDKAKLTEERCGALLAVARGSNKEPRMVVLQHLRGGKSQPTLALVGKGVTFDSGGLSLKPSDSMKAMKADMAGAATVLGVMQTVARLALPINVVGYMGLVENMTGGDAYKLGDVLFARNGTTIEVLNTDAEGRLVLADVLDVAVTRGADRVIDLATLTGACVVALGLDVAGLMTNDQPWCDQLKSSAEFVGELVWQLPMFPEFDEQILSRVADIRNIGEGRWGGAITAAKFLARFVGDTPWTHIDIAGPAYAEKQKAWLDQGGTGCMVRTLVHLLRALRDEK